MSGTVSVNQINVEVTQPELPETAIYPSTLSLTLSLHGTQVRIHFTDSFDLERLMVRVNGGAWQLYKGAFTVPTGTVTIEIKTLYGDGTESDGYQITKQISQPVEKIEAKLENIVLNNGEVKIGFNSDQLTYEVSVANSVKDLSLA